MRMIVRSMVSPMLVSNVSVERNYAVMSIVESTGDCSRSLRAHSAIVDDTGSSYMCSAMHELNSKVHPCSLRDLKQSYLSA